MSIELTAILIVFTAMLLAGNARAVAQESILYNFSGGADGGSPYAGLIFDASGNLYGTTAKGGDQNNGTVFELTPQKGGSWTEKVPYEFNPNGRGGANPFAGLIFDEAGNLYGTTNDLGTHNDGTVFKLSPTEGGHWTESALHQFNEGNGKDGGAPWAGLISDSQGNFYGTTETGGTHGGGIVFELSPKAGGGWKETVLYNFSHYGKDGSYPWAGLVRDAAGNLYGTTSYGGTFDWGTVFELSPKAGGGWKETVLHNFNGNVRTDGYTPMAGLVLDAAGNLYGTTYFGGTFGVGTVFELSPKARGGWKETVLHSFNDNGSDGYGPQAGLILDAAGNLYGTTLIGGSAVCTYYGSCGTVFELMPQADGSWTEKVLHSFSDDGTDGYWPYASLTLDAAGNLYGTTWAGGAQGNGTVFEITP
jgi:uncharacterized repeat protein (TIGR03803 family)